MTTKQRLVLACVTLLFSLYLGLVINDERIARQSPGEKPGSPAHSGLAVP